MNDKNPELDSQKAQCNHGQAQMNSQSSIGQAGGGLYPPSNGCPYCQPRCPCCGRPLGNYNYPHYPFYPYGYNHITC